MHIFLKLFLFILILAGSNEVNAQSAKKNKKKGKGNAAAQQPSSVNPYYPQIEYSPKRAKSSKGVTYSAEERFYDRLETVAKQRRKAEKELAKPQYSDPMYFGHKRMPKKNKPGKIKFCKECGIRH